MATYKINYVREKVSDNDPFPITSSKDAYSYVIDNCFVPSECWREMVYAIYLDSNHKVLGHLLIAIGGFSGAIFEGRLVVKSALDCSVTAVILAHNHPSGNPVPSKKDIEETEKISRALKLFNLTFVDHIIVGDGNFYSFDEESVKNADKPQGKEK